MVELKPSELKLIHNHITPSAESFHEKIECISIRYVDLIGRGSGRRWANDENTVVFELRSPTINDLLNLIKVISTFSPTKIDFMHSFGEHCIVYMFKWRVEDEN